MLYDQYQRFVPMVMVVERGDATGAWYWKGFQQQPLCLKYRSVLPGINNLKNTLRSYVVVMHLEITN
jgi:hypothetical protein